MLVDPERNQSRARMKLLRRDEGEAFRQIEADLSAENRARTGASTVGLMHAVLEDVPKERLVLVVLRHSLYL